MRKFNLLLAVLVMVLAQCKSHEYQTSIINGDRPTLMVDEIMSEHQYEGKSSEQLAKVEIAGKVKIVPSWAFAIVPALEEVKLSAHVKVLDDNAFFSCKNLSKINLNDVRVIGENCFIFSALERVELKRARMIKEFAFSCCFNLKDIDFSDCLEEIGDFAFSGDTAIIACHIPSGKIGTSAFMGCAKLEQITFGKAVSIGNSAFLDCISLSSVVIPSTVKIVGSEAFAGCSSLKSAIICSHKTQIAEDAFEKDVVITYKE